MPLIKSRDIKYNELKDLFAEITRKSKANELGNTQEERLTNTLKTLELGSKPLEHALSKFVTNDPKMNAVKGRIRLLYQRPEPVLITGPTGVGKELLAKALTIP